MINWAYLKQEFSYFTAAFLTVAALLLVKVHFSVIYTLTFLKKKYNLVG